MEATNFMYMEREIACICKLQELYDILVYIMTNATPILRTCHLKQTSFLMSVIQYLKTSRTEVLLANSDMVCIRARKFSCILKLTIL